jgi:hypothetical protein
MSGKWLAVAAVIATLVVALVGVERMASQSPSPHVDSFVAASPATELAPEAAPLPPTAADASELRSLGHPALTR